MVPNLMWTLGSLHPPISLRDPPPPPEPLPLPAPLPFLHLSPLLHPSPSYSKAAEHGPQTGTIGLWLAVHWSGS